MAHGQAIALACRAAQLAKKLTTLNISLPVMLRSAKS